jgi:hypothetical protein
MVVRHCDIPVTPVAFELVLNLLQLDQSWVITMLNENTPDAVLPQLAKQAALGGVGLAVNNGPVADCRCGCQREQNRGVKRSRPQHLCRGG